jgi:hypothetical protein
MALGSSPYAAERTPQKAGEGGWTPEVNEATNRAYEGMGGEIKRCYRVYERVFLAEAQHTDSGPAHLFV